MRRRLIFALLPLAAAAAAYGAPPQPPGKVTIQLGKGQTPADVQITRRKTSTSKTILLTVNPDWPVEILQYVEMHGGLHVDPATIPAPRPGSSEFRVKATTVLPGSNGVDGAFRLNCYKPTHFLFDDSIVSFGQPGKAHLHVFFGNDGSDAFSTDESLRTTGGGGCAGGIANRSTYWAPGLLNTQTAGVVEPEQLIVYYKTGHFSPGRGYGWAGPDGVWHEVMITDPATGQKVRKFPGFSDMPTGLRIIAGNPGRTTARLNSDPFDFRWSCILPGGGTREQQSAIPIECPADGKIVAEVFEPQCWDGKNLDAPDHKGHMSYPVNVRNEGDPRGWSHPECPATHPVVLPATSLQIYYVVPKDGSQRYWRLASDMYDPAQPAGYSLHGDRRNLWDPAISGAWKRNCLDAMKDCHADLLGDGRTLY